MMSAQTTNEQELDIKGKDLLTLADFSSNEILAILAKAKKIKEAHLAGESYTPLKGKTLGMIFEKSSTRTRVSFEAGMLQLGGHALFLSSNDLQIGRGEPISDTAQVLSQYLDGIMIRTFEHEKVEELAKYATIPVINGLTDLYHPCQALADLLTIQEQKGENLKGLKLAYIGDGNNVAHSLLIAAAKVGLHISVASPKGYKPDEKLVELAQGFAKESGAQIIITDDPVEAVLEADAIYTDVWTSMGQEKENEIRMNAFAPTYQVNLELAKHAKNDFIFLHCLPAHRGEEVTADIIDGSHSVVFQEAGNRLHAQKALLVEILKWKLGIIPYMPFYFLLSIAKIIDIIRRMKDRGDIMGQNRQFKAGQKAPNNGIYIEIGETGSNVNNPQMIKLRAGDHFPENSNHNRLWTYQRKP